MNEPSTYTADHSSGFRAFISYSHHDAAFARRLFERLEAYPVPKALVGQPTEVGAVPRRLAPIFRDRDELPSAPDLGAKIKAALADSLFLLVVASPWSARSRWVDQEVRVFKAMGRADRVLVIIVDGEPNASDRQGLEAQECFCPALRFVVDDRGDLTSTRAEPIAADARKGGDGHDDAVLKVIAGLLGVGFDRVKQRERLRARRRRLVRATLGGTAAVVAAAFYIGLADLKVPVPADKALQTALDHFGVTLFRPVATPAEVATALAKSRAILRERLTASVTKSDWFKRPGLVSVWEFGQIATALARSHEATPSDLAQATRQLTAALDVLPPKTIDNRLFGWTEPDGVVRTESSLWMLMGLAAVIPRDAALPQATRDALMKLLDNAQEIAALSAPMGNGGWNDVPHRNDPTDYYTYSTALALHALLDLKEAGLCWRGDCARLDAMIAKTSALLIAQFIDRPNARGWGLDRGDDLAPDTDLSTVVLGALGRAALNGGVVLPRPIHDFAYTTLVGFETRPYQPSGDSITKFTIFVDWRGQTRQESLPSRLLWLPWTLTAVTAWQHIAVRDGAAPETKRGLARTLGHVAVDLAPEMRVDLTDERSRPYVTAETMAGLDRAP